jgi:hypothetical protein
MQYYIPTKLILRDSLWQMNHFFFKNRIVQDSNIKLIL